jgi:hypothetical protein
MKNSTVFGCPGKEKKANGVDIVDLEEYLKVYHYYFDKLYPPLSQQSK